MIIKNLQGPSEQKSNEFDHKIMVAERLTVINRIIQSYTKNIDREFEILYQ